MFRTLVSGLLDLLAPPECPGCALDWQAEEPGQSFCAACSPLIELPPETLRPPARDAAGAAFQGPVADAIRRFKYAGASHLASPLTLGLLVTPASAYADRIECLVPMPLHPRKLRERGFNPSALLAGPLAHALGVPLRTGWLTRSRYTRDQAGLSSEQRQLNVRGAFHARVAPARRILLLDDVRTTGATLREAAATLEARGHEVHTLALAWAPEA